MTEEEEKQKVASDIAEPTHNDLISILNNVGFGLVRCDIDCKILPGYSYSLRKVLSVDEDTNPIGMFLYDLLHLPERDKNLFLSSYHDIFEDDFFSELAATNISKTYKLEEKHLNVKATPIVGKGSMTADSVLFVVEDATSTIHALEETHELRSVLNLIRNKSAFQSIVSELAEYCKKDRNEFKTDRMQSHLRAKLHNWKGSLGFLALDSFVEDIHAVEDFRPIAKAHLVMLAENFREFLAKHEAYLDVEFTHKKREEFKLVAEQMHAFTDKVKETLPTSFEAVLLIEEFFDDVTSTKLSVLLQETPKMVKRIATSLEKHVQFEISRGDALIPLRYQDLVRNCLHIIRNAVYHGIETEAKRNDLGKDPMGTILLSFVETQGHWGIEITDDGAGINVERLKQKAVENCSFTQDEIDAMNERDLYQLIFTENLSTADVTNKIAGRGVGLAGLKAEVLAHQGKILVFNKPEQGCKFLIWIPKNGTSSAPINQEDLRGA